MKTKFTDGMKHSLNPNEKLLGRFYEPLILLSILDPTRGRREVDSVTDSDLHDGTRLWRKFLDQLCFLCDSEKGGDTVAAIGAQRTVEGTVFWLASNSKPGTNAKSHVDWILSQLRHFYVDDQGDTEIILQGLIDRCVEFSSRRIKSYGYFLAKAIEGLLANGQPGGNEDDELLKALQPFKIHQSDPSALCAYADELRPTRAMQILNSRHLRHETYGPWSDIRHNIGRLRCWTKAVKILVEAAQRFPQQLEGATVKLVRHPGTMEIPSLRSNFDIESLVRRMNPSYDQQSVSDELVQSLYELDSISSWMDKFKETYSTFQPRPHAELLVLERFFTESFEFVRDERYIGCSKPSCFCCSLYMQVHSGRFEQRACHGNLYPNWSPPIPLEVLKRPNKVDGQGRKPQDHPTFKLLNKMMVNIRIELKEQILSRRPRRAKQRDTSTNISTSLLAIKVLEADSSAISNTERSREMPLRIFQANLLAQIEKPTTDLLSDSDPSSSATYCKVGPTDLPTQIDGCIEEALVHIQSSSTNNTLICMNQSGNDIESEDDGGDVLVFRGRGNLSHRT